MFVPNITISTIPCLPLSLTIAIFQVLSDDEKKSLYDKYGEAGLKGAGMGMGMGVSMLWRQIVI